MRKFRNLIIIILVFLGIMAISNSVNATTSSVTLQKLEVTTPSGTYTTGQEITIVATFSGNLDASSSVPYLSIQFGTYSTGFVDKGTISGNTITYKYTIESNVGGELSLEKYCGSLKDEAGDTIFVDYTGGLSGSTIKVNPLIWADASNFTAKIEKDDSIANLYLSGISNANTDMYVYITNGNTEPSVWNSESKDFENNYFSIWGTETNTTLMQNIDKYIELSGDIYVWIYQSQKDYSTGEKVYKLIKSSKVERPDQNPLGARTNAYFFDESTSIFIREPIDDNKTRNVKIKIGKVTDRSILKSIKNGESGCLSKLLTYAKSSDSIYTGTIKVETNGTSITSNMNLVDDEYYYVYMVLDDENGKYYPLEDISLYQALVSDSVGKNLFNYLDDKFTWNLDDETTETPSTSEPTDSTITPDTKLPQTGATVTTIAIIGITAVIAVVAGIKVKKYNF